MNRFPRNRCIAMLLVLLGLALPVRAEERLRMSTTTSTENSGLLSVLLPPFEKKHGCKVDVVAVGTGKALKLGEAGDVDVVFVHARTLEDKFVASGFGVNRRDVMYNDFVVVGPPDDPAGVGKTQNAPEAFRAISVKGSPFISRGDDSGTHQKEKEIWASAGIVPKGAWYVEAGQGMGRSSRWPPRSAGTRSPTAARTSRSAKKPTWSRSGKGIVTCGTRTGSSPSTR